jgi:hypothetical protein
MKTPQEKIHPMQLGGISAEQAQQMPEKQCTGSHREKKHYAICAASPVVLPIAVSQTSRRATRQINLRYFISAGVYFAGTNIH